MPPVRSIFTFSSPACNKHFAKQLADKSICTTRLMTFSLDQTLVSSVCARVCEKFVSRTHTLFLIVMSPLKRPSARYCPSFVQLQAVTRLFTLCFDTDFCSGDHRPARIETSIDPVDGPERDLCVGCDPNPCHFRLAFAENTLQQFFKVSVFSS